MAKSSAAAAADAVLSPASPARHTLLPLEQLRESPSNHRRTWGDMDELTESVRRQGVLQPVLARPAGEGFELVFGHRRFRAAKKAGLTEIPAMVREMGDLEVLEAQVVENLQRQDVHPLEEAEGYEQLLAQKERAYTVDDIAAKVGKSKAYVYGRLKLTALCPAARKAFYERGELSASVALLIARIPVPELQEKALEEVLGGPDDGMYAAGPMSFRDAQEHIVSKYTLRLGEAPFDRGDAELVAGAGPCSTCPKRTGAQPELFGDVKSGDVCTDPTCFASKKEAAWKKKAGAARAEGVKVLTATETKKVFSRNGASYGPDGERSNLAPGAHYVDLAERCYDDPKQRTYKQLLGKAVPEKVLARDPRSGRVRELVDREAAAKALAAAGVKTQRPPPAFDAAANREKYEREERIRTEAQRRVAAAIVARFEKVEPDAKLWRLIVDSAADNYDTEAVIERRFLSDKDSADRKEMDAAVSKMGEGELRGFALELALVNSIYSGLSDATPAGKALLAWAKVDAKAIEKTVKAELAAKEKAAAGDLARADTKGPAVARKGGRRG